MTIELFGHDLLPVALEASQRHSLAFFQSGALIGIIAIMLMFRKTTVLSIEKTPTLGIFLGLTNIILNFFMTQLALDPIKDHLLTDFLFLAAFLGGWVNALPAGILAFIGRFAVGGTSSIIPVGIDIGIILCCSLLLRRFLFKDIIADITLKTGIQIVLLRFIIVEIPPTLIYFFIPGEQELSIAFIVRRFMWSFSFSIVIFFAVVMLLRRAQAWDAQMYVEVLSKLPNRRALQIDFEEIYRSGQKRLRTLLLVDIYNFRDLVQELGHDWADDFFRRMGQQMTSLTHEPWLAPYSPKVYCFSDRSFALLLHDIKASGVEEQQLAYRVHNELAHGKHCMNTEAALRLWLNIGVFDVLPLHLKFPARFLRALTLVERSEKGGVQYFSPSVTTQIHRETQTRQSIEEWIKNADVPLWLQPKVILETGRCIGAEALLRAQENNAAAKFISPPQVLAIAATHHMLDELEWAIFLTAVGYLEQMPPELVPLQISVNLSPYSLQKPGLGKDICDLLAARGIAGERLYVEVIETSCLSTSDPVVCENIAQIVQAGIGLSLDDFGTGYSSISLLSRLPFTELKLDYSMISQMHNPRVHAAILLVTEGAERYNAVVVAEGVETVEQQRQLQEIGIYKGQGYLFGKAMPVQEFMDYARAQIMNEDLENTTLIK